MVVVVVVVVVMVVAVEVVAVVVVVVNLGPMMSSWLQCLVKACDAGQLEPRARVVLVPLVRL